MSVYGVLPLEAAFWRQVAYATSDASSWTELHNTSCLASFRTDTTNTGCCSIPKVPNKHFNGSGMAYKKHTQLG